MKTAKIILRTIGINDFLAVKCFYNSLGNDYLGNGSFYAMIKRRYGKLPKNEVISHAYWLRGELLHHAKECAQYQFEGASN